ncbi:hypothetical protein H4W81_007026 [Nonomuraea africana]|uniref:Uncharacterized protein n=1 Tax=Nonomuraea africana TaxID=46171 RepID=A0ABR9KQE5_9ACTN|nr:hypothetical protein [Nonomuraea africana]
MAGALTLAVLVWGWSRRWSGECSTPGVAES